MSVGKIEVVDLASAPDDTAALERCRFALSVKETRIAVLEAECVRLAGELAEAKRVIAAQDRTVEVLRQAGEIAERSIMGLVRRVFGRKGTAS